MGFTGSGAVVDLLREYESCVTLGGWDDESVSLSKKDKIGEIDFVRIAGGLFEIPKFLGSNNVFHNDALLNRYALMISASKLYNMNPDIRNLFLRFFDEIIDFRISNIEGVQYNVGLYRNKRRTNILFLKDLTIDEYYNLCRKLMYSVFFNLLKSYKSNLVLDQFFSDLEFNIIDEEKYLPNIKTIVVYRDPRDVYVFAVDKNVQWIPHNNVTDFIKWNKIMYKKFGLHGKGYLAVRFEELVLSYETIVEQIESYLLLEKKEHFRKMQHFKPELSARNIGLWKSCRTIPASDFKKIHEELTIYCFEE